MGGGGGGERCFSPGANCEESLALGGRRQV